MIIHIKISLVSFLSLLSAYLVQFYIIVPIESTVSSHDMLPSSLFLPYGIMVLLAIYFSWASVMAIFAAHITAFYLTDNLFIFSENWTAALVSSVCVPFINTLLVKIGILGSAFYKGRINAAFFLLVGSLAALSIHLLVFYPLKKPDLGVVFGQYLQSFVGYLLGLFVIISLVIGYKRIKG